MANRRLARAGVFAAAAMLVVTACGGTAAPSPSAGQSAQATAGATAAATDAAATAAAAMPNVWYVNPLTSADTWAKSSKNFGDKAAEGGYKATLVGTDKIDIPAMISLMEQAIADKADGVITCSLDPASFKDIIAKSQAAGEVVVSIGCVDDNADYSVGTDNKEFGHVAADVIAEAKGPAAKVVVLASDKTTPNQVLQVEGFKEQIAAKYPDMKLLAWEGDNSDPAIATEKIGAILSAYPDLDALWMIEGAAPTITPAALKEAGKKPGDIFVLGIDAPDLTLQAVKDGWITQTLNQCWFDAAPFAAQLIAAKKAGNGPEQKISPVPVDPISADRLPYAGCPADLLPKLP